MKLLTVGLDGLRPDLCEPDPSPDITHVQSSGVTRFGHGTTNPSETHVVFPRLAGGTTLGGHGLVGSKLDDSSGRRSALSAEPEAYETGLRTYRRSLRRNGFDHAISPGSGMGENGATASRQNPGGVV